MRIRTIISAVLAATILPRDGQLLAQQHLRSLPEVAIDDPPMTMIELGKDAYSMSMVKFVGLRPTPSTADHRPIFRDSSVAMISSRSEDFGSEGDSGSKSGKGGKSSGEGACPCSSGKSGKAGGSKSGGSSTTCPSLQDLFGGSSKSSKSGRILVEVNKNSEDIAPDGTTADFNTTADMDLWHENRLYQNSSEDTDNLIGTSSGFRTLLPGAKNFQCAMTWTLDTGDIFYLTGLSPNSNESGVIAITGGTGCAKAAGSIQMRALGEDFESYEYELLEPPSTTTCTPLGDRFWGGLTENNTNSEAVAADGRFAGFNKTADQRLWSENDLSSNDAADIIGKSSGFCTLLPSNPNSFHPVFQCAMTWTFDDMGDSIYLSGLSRNHPDRSSVVAITGGTGCYENAAGSVLMTGVGANFESYEYELLEPPPEAAACVPLEDVFAAPGLLEVNDHWEGVTADGGEAYFNKTADMDLSFGNPLYQGNSSGQPVGLSYGFRTLLPGIAVFQCSTTLTIDESNDGRVTLAGLSPNSNETGILVVTGGTGCYEGATGAVEFTAQGQGDVVDSYLYVWKNTTEEDDTCDC